MSDIIKMIAARGPLIMGILNITPDSFSDGGRYSDVDMAVVSALTMVRQGAAIIDIGGESTRPGSERVPAQEQIDRIVPVITALRAVSAVPVSVDTTLAAVARAALNAGADIINDISALEEDPAMALLAAECNCPVILMHKQGTPANMQDDPQYDNP
ncbi:MAG: dihydropteroate synthase, partial [Sedimentisphaerales bacterium]|nr:dihydropteroate synthase [Sedimentisphaerales bacterium]